MSAPVLFFDIGDTLGVPDTDGGALRGIRIFPFVPEILSRLRPQCRLGLLSNTGRETLPTLQRLLADAGIIEFFETSLQLFSSIEGVDKTTVEIFHRAVARAGTPASRCVYISEDDAERELASRAGMQVSYHPLHVFHVIETLG